MGNESFIFKKYLPALGVFRLRPLQIPQDIGLIHDWVNREYAQYWGLAGNSLGQVEAEYRKIVRQAMVYVGFCNGQPAFLLECYDPKHHELAGHYDWQAGDRGMHILVAPAERPLANFTWSVFTVIMDFIFSDPAVRRIVVEPDIRNGKIHALNKRAGFECQKTIVLSTKTAHLAFCDRRQYQAALDKEHLAQLAALAAAPGQVASHLRPDLWAKANALHLRKAISEFAHELLIQPELEFSDKDWGHYRLKTGQPTIEYRFRARVLSLEHWDIDLDSLEKSVDGDKAALDSLSFIVEMKDLLGISEAVLPTYMEEITSTLFGSAYKHGKPGVDVGELVHADFQSIETAMMEGHPTFIANNGRIGFDALDYRAYAPEAASPVKLIWLAAHKSKADFVCAEDLSYAELMEQELGRANLEKFAQRLQKQGLDAEDYWYMPAHPWQWHNKLAVVFAADIAARHLVCLGYGEDSYLAQQSIRTFFNASHPYKRYVKTALSILNMGFMRGLSPYYMSATPAINDCLNGLIEHDPYFAKKGFRILREVASMGYHNRPYELATPDNPYKKMLAVLWRESPLPQLKPGQRLMTMAALLHVDAQGTAFLPELIKLSGIGITAWLKRYLDCYLSPLLHCLYAYDLTFMPHGENVILVLEGNIPVRAFMKDIAEEAAIMNKEVVLAEKVRRLSVFVPEELKTLQIFTDCFDLIFRYLSQILLAHAEYPERQFWRLAADCVAEYQAEHPELAERFQRLDLFAPEFTRSCLNRLQLGNNQQMVDLANPAGSLQFVGTLQNPIAAFRPKAAAPEPAEALA